MKSKKVVRKAAKSHKKVSSKVWGAHVMSGKLAAKPGATKLRVARVKKEVSQGAIARKLGLSTASYAAIEGGARPVSVARAAIIARELKVSQKAVFKAGAKNKMVALVGR